MPFYVRRGSLPPKRHTVFKKPGGGLHYEELVSREGFSSLYTNMYHLRPPTAVRRVGELHPERRERATAAHRHHHLRTAALPKGGDAVGGRKLLLFNQDCAIHKAHPDRGMDYLYRNGHHDELIYVQSGTGVLATQLGDLRYGPGDYLVIPRSTTWRLTPDGPSSLLVVESTRPIATPKRYRNPHGQLLEHSPFCERDIRVPELGAPRDEAGEFRVVVRLEGGWQEYTYASHPFDVAGWDGYLYPWALNIKDFEPIVGAIHQPPSVHQTFEADGFVVCSFVSRPYDFNERAIPAPYPHSNIDSDEVLFYSLGNFMSRRGIEAESISFHPAGLPHGPHPGKYEGSIGQKWTDELAVMIDTFRPLYVAAEALAVDDADYPLSWLG